MAEHAEYTVAAETYRHYKRGDTVLLRQHVADKLVEEGVVKPKSEKLTGREAEPQSPLADLGADEAKDKISRMTSEDNLKAVATADTRSTVQKAAQDRLAELKAKASEQQKK